MLKPGGTGNPETFILTGHGWYEEPYQNNSTKLGPNPISSWLGSRPQFASINSFDLLIDHAGGEFNTPGDYLYRTYQGSPFTGGAWGLMRVSNRNDAPTVVKVDVEPVGALSNVSINGTCTVIIYKLE